MKQTVYFSQFVDSFGESHKDNFNYDGKRALFDYLESYEEDVGTEIELDIIALCCDYAEYPTAMDAAKEYGYTEGINLEEHGNVDLLEVQELEEKQALEWLQDRTTVITFDTGIIIQQF